MTNSVSQVRGEGNPVPALWRMAFQVRHSEGRRDGNLKLRALFDYAQEGAACHAEALGVGIHYLRTAGKLWVLSQVEFALERLPRIGDAVTLCTYPQTPERIFASRQFEFFDAQAQRWGYGSSLWLLLDRTSLRPLKIQETLPSELPDNAERPVFFPDLRRHQMKNVPIDDTPDWYMTVRESQIDVNEHLNNAEYSALVDDFLARKIGAAQYRVTRLRLQFLQACRTGDEIAIHGAVNPDGSFRVWGVVDMHMVFAGEGMVVFHE